MEIKEVKIENTFLFEGVKDVEDIIKMNKFLLTHHTDESVRYIASELGHNAIKTSDNCDVIVNCSKVETLIKGKEEKFREVENYLKSVKNNNGNNETVKSKKMGGKGIISIISMGWEIMVEQLSSNVYRVSAFNRAN